MGHENVVVQLLDQASWLDESLARVKELVC
jgi:hypothetical protein